MNVEDHAAGSRAFFDEATHPTLGRPYQACTYAPMVELLRYLGGERLHAATSCPAAAATSCARSPATIYGIPPERVVGSAQGLRVPRARTATATCSTRPRMDFFDDGPGEAGAHLEPDRPTADPVGGQLQRRRRDAGVLRAGRSAASLRLLVLHDDAEREFDYTAGAERALDARREQSAGPSSA